MSTPIYKNEQAWRAHMLVAQSATRHSIHELAPSIVGVLVLYLISTYSVPVALGIAICWLGYELWVVRRDSRKRQAMLGSLSSDPELDV